MSASTKPSHPSDRSGPDIALSRENERLKAEIQRLRERLDRQAIELTSYQLALRGSKITIFTHDRMLRYTAISDALCGREPTQILGRTDEQIFPGPAGAIMRALKREALESGEQRRGEVVIDDLQTPRWLDLYIEPLRTESGSVIGLACIAVDISRRKEDEAHLRLLLRELTHRSKNLLAVIQAVARQTARHADSIETFLDQFSGRLQALAAAHDLLVRGSWHGASMQELVHAQLAAYFDGEAQRVVVQGPPIVLKPEAAQSLGLALHELAANAARFGALSVEQGRVAITWKRDETPRGEALVVDWSEEAGPEVQARRKKGFGSAAIERNLTRALDADVSLDFDPHGLRCHIVIPAGHFMTPR